MSNWDYVPEERTRISAGDYRVEVLSAEEKTSSKGNRMIVIVIRPNGSDIKISHYITRNEYFNKNMTEFFDSCGIERGNFNFLTWTGAVGAARLKEDDQGYLKVSWFLDPKRAEKLPEWTGTLPERQTVTEIGGNFTEVEVDSDLPF